ncbi:MAG: formylglycine-generating enzyme family protein [Pirellulales bacterium]|nr:formylglycine-generating enzyme family protein [Pirellulales bacterium]
MKFMLELPIAMVLWTSIAAGEPMPAAPAAGQPWRDAYGVTYCWCPPGKLAAERGKHEFAQGFWIAKYEISRHTVELVNSGKDRGEAARRDPEADRDLRSWRSIVVKLNEQSVASSKLRSGWFYALPTEFEWEYACRAGATTSFSFGDDPADLPLYGNFADRTLYDLTEGYRYADRRLSDGVARVARSGGYRPNAWGLHDMHGNLWEWCESGIVRGGGWCSLAEYCRSDSRHDLSLSAYNPRYSNNERVRRPWIGARLVIRSAPRTNADSSKR